jgi:hypothetical protein
MGLMGSQQEHRECGAANIVLHGGAHFTTDNSLLPGDLCLYQLPGVPGVMKLRL